MQEAVQQMFSRYLIRTGDDAVRALREIIQECALLGLWRSKFFEHAAFYGGTALRILYGLDRFSEDLDFTLLKPESGFRLTPYLSSLEKELRALGFEVSADLHSKTVATPIQSAFLKGNTRAHIVAVSPDARLAQYAGPNQTIKIKLEIDTDPPPGFSTEFRYLLQPIPFAVRSCTLPDLFAGKMHALLFRKWKHRVKGRDWYDFVWYVTHHPVLNLRHLEMRMRQTGAWSGKVELGQDAFFSLLHETIDQLDVDQAQREVRPFVKDPSVLDAWSREFFRAIAARITFVQPPSSQVPS